MAPNMNTIIQWVHSKNCLKINEAEFDDPKFDYVVEIKHGERVCFGSTAARNTDPIGKGLAPHQKRIATEIFPETGPGCYRVEDIKSAMADQLNKIRSVLGVPPLASRSGRFPAGARRRAPSPGRYETRLSWATRPAAAPFGVGGAARAARESDVPGPATYDVRRVRRCRRPKKMDNFGHPTMTPCVEVVCVARATATCVECGGVCGGGGGGDYWRRDGATFLCLRCWRAAARGRGARPRRFRKTRDCSFAHRHEGTAAALHILSVDKIVRKTRIENYLEEYVECF